ncbi:MAG: hypothetical protein K0B07_04360 [DPANN group archaeon]|nr:hypothetical protein [DPANN group archaeon]
MSDSCASCSGSSCSSTYSSLSTTSADSKSINYDSISTSSIYSDIKSAGGLDAAINIYGVKDIAEQIYLDNSSNPDKIADIFNDTNVYGVDNLPYGVAGMIKSSIGYDSTGEMIIDADIFYNNNLSANDTLYTTLHELAHREQLEYSTNMLRSFGEGDAELTAEYMINEYMNQLEKQYNAHLNTSDPVYDKCKGIVENIYYVLGKGNIEEGQETFYNALETYGDFFKAMDSFNSVFAELDIDLAKVYNALEMLDRELETKMYNPENSSSTPISPIQIPYTDTMPQGTFGTAGIAGFYSDITSQFDTTNFQLADIFSSNITNIWDLLRKQEEIHERYLRNLYH